MARDFEQTWRYKGPFTWPDPEPPLDIPIYTGVSSPPMKPKHPPRKGKPKLPAKFQPEQLTLLDLSSQPWYSNLTKEYQQKCNHLAELADATTEALAGAISKYSDLVLYVRDSHLDPHLVTETLKARGFKESRISEVKRVAFGDPELLDRIRQQTIGFKSALAEARGKPKLDKAAKFTLRLNTAVARLIRVAEHEGEIDRVEGPWHIKVWKVETDAAPARPF